MSGHFLLMVSHRAIDEVIMTSSTCKHHRKYTCSFIYSTSIMAFAPKHGTLGSFRLMMTNNYKLV